MQVGLVGDDMLVKVQAPAGLAKLRRPGFIENQLTALFPQYPRNFGMVLGDLPKYARVVRNMGLSLLDIGTNDTFVPVEFGSVIHIECLTERICGGRFSGKSQ